LLPGLKNARKKKIPLEDKARWRSTAEELEVPHLWKKARDVGSMSPRKSSGVRKRDSSDKRGGNL